MSFSELINLVNKTSIQDSKCLFSTTKKCYSFPKGSRTKKVIKWRKPGQDKTEKLMLHKSMQPHGRFPEQTLTICIVYLWHFLSAATQQRGEKRKSKNNLKESSRPLIWSSVNHVDLCRVLQTQLPNHWSHSLMSHVQSWSRSTNTHQSMRKCTDRRQSMCNVHNTTEGGDEECVSVYFWWYLRALLDQQSDMWCWKIFIIWKFLQIFGSFLQQDFPTVWPRCLKWAWPN